MKKTMLETVDLVKYFDTKNGIVHAVDHVNLSIPEGETLGVVGESGCGKSTLGRTILNLIPATSGQILFDGKNILERGGKSKDFRQKMQIIFQDPYSSLDPRQTVFNLIAEPLKTNRMGTKAEMREKVEDIMNTVGLAPRLANAYPHELDGGRRQRIGVARALVMDPKFVVCDEPVSALDVSIQAQILNLMMDVQEERGITYMFITHDLSVVKHISHSIAVMYLGEVVELAPKEELFAHPRHPYTKALLSAVPIPDPSRRNMERQLIKGEVTSPIDPAPGCRFAPRCPYATPECLSPSLGMTEVGPNHQIRCCHPLD